MPQDITLAEIRGATKAAKDAWYVLRRGVKHFETYPLDRTGAVGLVILTMCITEESPDLTGMLGGYSFAKQSFEKFGYKAMTEDVIDSCEQALISFDSKYGRAFRKYAIARISTLPDTLPWKRVVLDILVK